MTERVLSTPWGSLTYWELEELAQRAHGLGEYEERDDIEGWLNNVFLDEKGARHDRG